MNVAVPTVTPYLPEPSKATGAAMVVCPGGGYFMLSIDSEGHNVARWLAEHGIAAFVLKYRTRYAGDTPEAVDKSVGAMFGGITGQRQLQAPAQADKGAGMNFENMSEEQRANLARMFGAGANNGPTVQDLAGDDGRDCSVRLRKSCLVASGA